VVGWSADTTGTVRKAVGRRYTAPSEHYPLSTSELGCVWRRSKKAGLNIDQKLLYILLHLQNWVSAARDAMVQSYEPEKMRPPVRYYGAPGGVNRGGRFFSGIGHFNHGSTSQ
jgi:hypothetical protein